MLITTGLGILRTFLEEPFSVIWTDDTLISYLSIGQIEMCVRRGLPQRKTLILTDEDEFSIPTSYKNLMRLEFFKDSDLTLTPTEYILNKNCHSIFDSIIKLDQKVTGTMRLSYRSTPAMFTTSTGSFELPDEFCIGAIQDAAHYAFLQTSVMTKAQWYMNLFLQTRNLWEHSTVETPSKFVVGR